MSAYFAAFIRITDTRLYDEYLAGFDAVFEGSGGEVVAVDDSALVLEGSPPGGRFVLMRFPDEASLRMWYDSPGYARLRALRQSASEGDVLLVHGR